MRLFTLTLALTLTAAAQQPKPNQLLQTAEAAQQAGDLPAAIRDYRALIELHPNFIDAHLGLGAALTQHADYDAAIQEFTTALALAKNKQQQPDILLALGLAYYKKGDFLHAKPQFQAVLDLQPENINPKKIRPDTIQAATMLGQCDLKLNDPEAALAVLQPRAFLADQNVEFARAIAFALIRTGSLHNGTQVLRHVAEATNTPTLLVITGAVSLENDEYEDARRDLETVHRINPTLAGVDSLLGLDRMRSADPYAAENAFREAVRNQPDDYLANLYLGVILLQRRDRAAAKPWLDRAIELQPALPPTLADESITLSPASELDPAVDMLRKVATENPTWPEPHILLVSLYDKLHQPNQAAAEQKIAATFTAKP
jgi:tetratricopeptide (TPR) repeat protein